VDGLRVDAVASMLYLDYARKNGDWIPNKYGGKENLEAIDFLKRLNEAVYAEHPDAQTIAEESSAWPMVSRPTYSGGLGFGMKWNMGWMHDTLEYFSKPPLYRFYHHNQLTFSIWYAFYENFLLPLSHDEVVYGKGSLINKMPGDEWQKFANLRLLFGYMYGHPGKKLLFMGGEFGQSNEWYHETSLDWHLLDHDSNRGVMRWLQDLNHLYRNVPALFERDFDGGGFEWIDCHNAQQSIISFLRKGRKPGDVILVICNMTPKVWQNYKVGVPEAGAWQEVLNSDTKEYGGSGVINPASIKAEAAPFQGRNFSISLTL
jgi:1,4-alpha-glucan branching enzyme